jgi:hypothetical protein
LPPPAILLFGADSHPLMSTTTPPPTENDPTRPISLLSLGRNTFIAVMNGMLTGRTDAGGPQGISQLLILKDVMERLSKDESGDSRGTVKRPCEVFDMIGGVGTGGSVWFILSLRFTMYLLQPRLIAIFLVVLKLTAKDALDEFTKFVVKVFKDVDRDPGKQTEKLTRAINDTLDRHGVAKDTKLVPTSQRGAMCKL